MKNILLGVVPVIFIYILLITGLDSASKSLIVGIVCSIIVFIKAARVIIGRNPRYSAYAFVVANIGFLIFLTINLVSNLHINPLIIWSSYFALTTISYVAAAALDSR